MAMKSPTKTALANSNPAATTTTITTSSGNVSPAIKSQSLEITDCSRSQAPVMGTITENQVTTSNNNGSNNSNNNNISSNKNNKQNVISFNDFKNAPINVPELLKMVTDPLNEYCRESTATTTATSSTTTPATQNSTSMGTMSKLRISNSEGDEGHDTEDDERNFGSISPIIHRTSRVESHNSASSTSKNNTNFRLKFRKSHTCGSLFANCNCSSPPPIPTQMPFFTATTAMAMAYTTTTMSSNPVTATRHSSITTPNTNFHLSISPSNAEPNSLLSPASTTSTRNLSTTSGYHSLSAQNSTATNASISQLSRDDESMSVSFDNAVVSVTAASTNSNSNSSHRTVAFTLGGSGSSNESAASFDQQGNSGSNNHQLVGSCQSLPRAKKAHNNSQSGRLSGGDSSTETETTIKKQLRISKSDAHTTSASPTAPRRSEPSNKSKRLFHAYSHPDTDFIFTDENKHPSRESLVQNAADSIITTRSGKVEFRHPKRTSSPNIGQYRTLDVAVHPDILIKISPKQSPITESRRIQVQAQTQAPVKPLRSAQQRRRLLQRSHEIESGGSTSESDQSFDVKSPVGDGGSSLDFKATNKIQKLQSPNGVSNATHPKPLSPVPRPKALKSLAESAFALASPTTNPVSSTQQQTPNSGDASFVAAQRYFAESGILGPINTSSNLIRKTSKILQDSNVIEQIRKTSMILRGNLTNSNINGIQRRVSSSTNGGGGSLPTSPTIVISPQHEKPQQQQQQNFYQQLQPPTTLRLQSNNNADMQQSPTTAIQQQLTNSSYSVLQHHQHQFQTKTMIPQSPNTMATQYSFSPNLTNHVNAMGTDDRDAQLKDLHGEIVSLKDVIKSRDAEILKLRREIHKLKSVLQQTTNPLPIVNDELLQSPTRTAAGQQTQMQTCACCKQRFENNASNTLIANGSSSSIDSSLSDNFQSCTSLMTLTGESPVSCASSAGIENMIQTPTSTNAANYNSVSALGTPTSPTTMNHNKSAMAKIPRSTHQGGLQAPAPVLKKQGVSGESCEISMQQSINVPIPKYDKDFSSKQLIKEAIMDNDFLKNIDASQVRELVESMYPLTVAKGEYVIREGEVGAHLYVSVEGELEVIKNDKVLGIMGAGKAFGELAILYNCTRTASVRVLSDARLWVLDRRVFQQIMMRTGMQRIENSVNFLKSVPLLKNLSEELLAKIADVLEVEFYAAGTYIIRQGASGDTFFLISQGSVKVTQKLSPTSEEKEIRILQRGDYFGEQALINEDKRTANIIALAPGVECLTLDRDSFTQLIGDLCELKEKNYGDENRVLAMKFAESTKEIFGANVKQEFPDMKLTDLEVVATLGIGGFGRVELVKAYRENRVEIFALKCLKKRHIVDTKQEEHVFSERTIMLSCNSPFICRLYRTFRDEKYVYMLLEACMGGEIWTMLRDRGSFDENATQFIIGCVLQAFEYLHSRGIIYRDLKPENLMLDERGYIKLVDFGFAKYIGNSSKTWTFCGTPEYVAPEIILNKGHDRAVDYWALGVLIHELLNGTPPFTSNDPMKTYNIILKGIDMIDFPKHMSRSAIQLIKRLCRDIPAERLGYQRGGIQDIKKHKWFLGFDWDGLASQLLIPPFVRPIAHPTDTAYFDKFPCDPNEVPDEMSGWDEDF